MRRHEDHPWEPRHRASVRHRVAVEAARMLFHREVKEYFHAKREAARRQGTQHLPSNSEVHEQLLLIARKVDGDEHLRRLTEMRTQALGLMERLEEFSPRLIGSVLTGHIRRGSDIDLHVFTEDVDAVCLALAENGHEFAVETVQTRKYGELREFVHVRLPDLGGFEAEITVYPVKSLHVQPRCGITGGPMKRATTGEVRALLQEPAAAARPCAAPVLSPPVREDDATRLIPELSACRGVLQNHHHHLDVYDHTWAVVAGLERMAATAYERFGPRADDLRAHFQRLAGTSMLLLAGLCHDIAKPATQTFGRGGRIHFYGHELLGGAMARSLGPRLGLDGTATEELARLVECHLDAVRIPAEGAEPSRIRRLLSKVGPRLPELALLSLADVEAARGPAQSASRLEEQAAFVQFLLEEYFDGGFLVNPTLPVTTDDLVEQFGALDARTVARLHGSLTDAFVDGEFEGRQEGLALASDLLASPTWERG